jgi:hypothetical protein
MNIKVVLVILPYGRLVFSNQKRKNVYEIEYFDKLYEIIKKAVLSYDKNIKCINSINKWGDIKSNDVENIFISDIVIAIATGRSSDVFWQLGIRHALKKGTIILQDIQDDTPLGLVGYSSYQYQFIDFHKIDNYLEQIKERKNCSK